MSALAALTANLAHAARNGGATIGGGIFTPAELREAIAELADHCGRFLVHCQAREQCAATDSEREFWRRLAGSVRKAGAL